MTGKRKSYLQSGALWANQRSAMRMSGFFGTTVGFIVASGQRPASTAATDRATSR